MVSLFPVRPLSEPLALDDLQRIIERYGRYEGLLPSRDYMVGLSRTLSSGRQTPCHVPAHVSFKVLLNGTRPESQVRTYFCECGGLRYYYGPICRSCHTHYDIYNSILSGRTRAETMPFGLFRNPLVLAYFRAQHHGLPLRRADRWIGRARAFTAHGKAKVYGNSF